MDIRQRWFQWSGGLPLELRHAKRSLSRSPGLAAVGIVTLGLGIGGTVTLFSFVKAVYLEPLPYAMPRQLVSIHGLDRDADSQRTGVSLPDLQDLASETSLLAGIAAYRSKEMNLSNAERPERVSVSLMTTSALDLLGIHPKPGRGFGEEDGEAGAAPVALISDALYEGRTTAGRIALGDTLHLDGVAHTVIGILPRDFAFLRMQPDLVIPYRPEELNWSSNRSARQLGAFARLKPEVDLEAARQELSVVTARLSQAYPDSNGSWGMEVEPLQHVLRPSRDVRAAMVILSVTLALVLLVACANVANLLLARIYRRGAELAVRGAVGASPLRQSQALLIESAALAAGGGLLGLLLGVVGVRGVVASIPVGNLSIFNFDLDLKALGFTMLVCGVTVVGTSLVPVMRVAAIDLARTLSASSAGSGRGTGRWGRALILIEVCVTFFLLVVSSVVLRGVQELHRKDLGFSPEQLLTFRVTPRRVPYTGELEVQGFYDTLLRNLAALPAVEAVGTIDDLTLTGADTRGPAFPLGYEDGSRVSSSVRAVSPGYFSALSVPMVEGRAFTAKDRSSMPLVAIVNQAWVRRWQRDGSVVGTRLRALDQRPREIVGVVRDYYEVRLDRPIEPVVYLPAEQSPSRDRGLVLRTAGEPSGHLASVLEVMQRIDPEQSIDSLQPMNDQVDRQAWVFKTMTKMLTALALLGLLMSMTGIFSVTSAAVGQRVAEVGIRMAVGASRGSILSLLLWEGVRLSVVGVLLAVPLSYAATRGLSGALYGVETAGLLIYLSLFTLVVVTTSMATFLPALRASNVDPIVALHLG